MTWLKYRIALWLTNEPWLMAVNIGIGLVCIALGSWTCASPRQRSREKFEYRTGAYLCAGIACICGGSARGLDNLLANEQLFWLRAICAIASAGAIAFVLAIRRLPQAPKTQDGSP